MLENLTPAQREKHEDTDRPDWTWMLTQEKGG
jgi:hypothetical protein